MGLVLTTLTGNYAVSYAVKLSRVKVVSAYPITPQTTIVEKIAQLIEDGEMDAEMIRVESEHSALAAAYGAASAGVRAFTATSSHGLLYMHEMLWWVAGSRIPLVMAVATRTIGPPWNIWTDHSDLMDQRDTGWLIAMAENNQEVLDETIKMFKITEDPRVYLPGIVGLDAFILTHTSEPVDIPTQEVVDQFLPDRRQPYVFKAGDPLIMGNIPKDLELNMRMREDIDKAMERAKKVIDEVDFEWGKLTGRRYGGLTECYRCEDAKHFIIGMGAWVGDMREAVDKLRSKYGVKVGLIKIRYVRPFPREDLIKWLSNASSAVVFDRSFSPGSGGHLFLETVAHASVAGVRTPIKNCLAGIAGVDVTYEDIVDVVLKSISEVEEVGTFKEFIEWYYRGGR
ncbi:MAG: pyruvate ferredoxin oxidoreductase [Zestosphaera tikiterensis]|uniref:2-oxoacid oxidoreductase (ferredoxin) n=1 Tax=Zestosphaera tikiterensis TaxID=1973259 RepID=A0A2R7Y652_9CREN|nr:MAG: pyruvate ferredoxin oxidoreductase [Zestosphaera tikiterensis]